MFGSMLLFGFLLGLRHAMEADHVAAVAAMATRTSSPRELLRLAAGWGTGHMLTLLAIGSVAIALGRSLPQASEAYFDCVIGIVLVVMGVGVLRRARARQTHAHVHDHGEGSPHLHLHFHDIDAAGHEGTHRHGHDHGGTWRALAMGTLHGMAGSAALLVLALPQSRSAFEAVAYLAVFGAGSIAGMLAFSVALSFPLRVASRTAGAIGRLESVLGAVTVMVGLRLLAGIP